MTRRTSKRPPTSSSDSDPLNLTGAARIHQRLLPKFGDSSSSDDPLLLLDHFPARRRRMVKRVRFDLPSRAPTRSPSLPPLVESSEVRETSPVAVETDDDAGYGGDGEQEDGDEPETLDPPAKRRQLPEWYLTIMGDDYELSPPPSPRPSPPPPSHGVRSRARAGVITRRAVREQRGRSSGSDVEIGASESPSEVWTSEDESDAEPKVTQTSTRSSSAYNALACYAVEPPPNARLIDFAPSGFIPPLNKNLPPSLWPRFRNKLQLERQGELTLFWHSLLVTTPESQLDHDKTLFRLFAMGLFPEVTALISSPTSPTIEDFEGLPPIPEKAVGAYIGLILNETDGTAVAYVGQGSGRPRNGQVGLKRRVSGHETKIRRQSKGSMFYNVARTYSQRRVIFRPLWVLPIDTTTATSSQINFARIGAIFAEALFHSLLGTYSPSGPDSPPANHIWPSTILVGVNSPRPLNFPVVLVGGTKPVWSEEVIKAYKRIKNKVHQAKYAASEKGKAKLARREAARYQLQHENAVAGDRVIKCPDHLRDSKNRPKPGWRRILGLPEPKMPYRAPKNAKRTKGGKLVWGWRILQKAEMELQWKRDNEDFESEEEM